VTVAEYKVYIAICIAMGIIKLPHIHDYWQIKHAVFSAPSFGLVISRDHFKQIHHYLHFSNEEEAVPKGEAGYDPLFKIRKLLDLL